MKTEPASSQNSLPTSEVHDLVITADSPDALLARIRSMESAVAESGGTISGRVVPELHDYRAILDAIVDSVLIADADGSIVDINRRASDRLKISRQQIGALNICHLISGADNSFATTVASTLEMADHVQIRAHVLRGDGTTFPARIYVSTTSNDNAPALFFFLHDDSRRIVERIDEDSSLASASTVAGQIAHDFDNLLTPLFTYPELIRLELPAGSRSHELLDVMGRTVRDMSNMTKQLLALSRRQATKLELVFLNDIVTHAATLLKEVADSKRIELELNLAEDLLPVEAAPEQMLRVVHNLLQNAMDAISGNGRIAMKTENIYVDRHAGRTGDIETGEYVRFLISDTGSGIPYELREKIFAPFYSTRRGIGQRGSGLGLSVVRGVVADHSGFIDLKSAPGHGTTFEIYLPACRRRPTEEQAPGAGEEVSAVASAGMSVLVVDDDPTQQEVIAGLFRQNSWKVFSAQSGEEAIRFLSGCTSEDDGKPSSATERFPDLVILDAVMDEGIDGREACNRILEINPAQKVIMTSGYASPQDVGIRYLLTNVAYVRKPLTWDSIRNALAHLQGRTETTQVASGLMPTNTGKILVVDDEEGISRLFRMILSSAFPKAEIDAASNGAEALELFQSGHHAVIVMDLRMPVMDGRSTFVRLQKVCAENNWRMPSIAFCTGFAPPQVVKDIVNQDRNHCLLTKPVSGDDLVLAVRERLAMQTI